MRSAPLIPTRQYAGAELTSDVARSPPARLFLFDSTENLHSMPPILLTALARARCAKGLVDLDWFPVSKFNVVAFFELMTTATNLQHLEIGEMCVGRSSDALSSASPSDSPLPSLALQARRVLDLAPPADQPAAPAHARHLRVSPALAPASGCTLAGKD